MSLSEQSSQPVTARSLPDAVTEDAFLGGRLMILQPRKGYRAGLDAVLLAAAAPLSRLPDAPPIRVLDAGSGVGVVGLCLARRVPNAHVTLVERDPALAALAEENIRRNDLFQRASVIEADVTGPLSASPKLAALAESFDLVLSNPPYHDEGFGTPAPDPLKAASHAMPQGHLDRWLRFMASMTRAGGAFAVIHRAEALTELLTACGRRFGGLIVRPFHPRSGAQASRIIVEGSKASRAPLGIAPGTVLHDEAGPYRANVEAVLREGAAFRPD